MQKWHVQFKATRAPSAATSIWLLPLATLDMHNTARVESRVDLHTARLQDEKYYSVTDMRVTGQTKVDFKKLDERGYYYRQRRVLPNLGHAARSCTWSDHER